MAFNPCLSLLFLFLLTRLVTSASSSFISHDVLQSHESTGRTLLQTKKSCLVNFEFLNYTIITSQCEGPRYINLYGKYPPSLFVSECREGKEGLECPAQAPSTESTKDSVNASRGQIVSSYSMLTLLVGFLVLLFHLS
ncbi:GPI-anchored protein LLG1-like [Vitis riparia]|uniref:GPI-anchored protein LLG1-like n=1 Tax=Vitis riparia TaxID=96939 RepID=UPI00155A2BBE|nr:GPI-anchored protein LLG1-like [Vitis riparia]